ncbi:MAG: caspase family protein [Myxococcota bacterium]
MIVLWTAAALAGTTRVGLFVGNNLGYGTDDPLVYAEEEARRMSRLFVDRGGVDRDRVTVLQGASAKELGRAIAQVEGQVREASARGDDAMVVFYYSGHASSTGLHMAGSLYGLRDLKRWLESSSADVRVAFVDACESGSLARDRGATAVEHVEVAVDDALTASGLAIVTSTGPLSAAREAASYGGGVFSRALITGLRGSADGNGDGEITLDEAYRYAFEQTVRSTARSGSAIQRPEYRYEIGGVGRVVLTRVPGRAAGLSLPEELEGTYTVVSVSSGQVVARVQKRPGEPQRIALPPGRYVVRKVRREDVLLAELDLAWGGDRLVDETQMSSVPLGDPLARGGWQPRPIRLTVKGFGSTSRLSGTPATYGGEIDLRIRISPRLNLGAFGGGGLGSVWDFTRSLQTTHLTFGTGLYAERNVGRVDLYAGVGPTVSRITQLVEALDLEQDDIDPVVFSAAQWVPGAFGHVGAQLSVGPAFGIDLGFRVHPHWARIDFEQWRTLFEMTGLAGISLRLRTRRIGRISRRAETEP